MAVRDSYRDYVLEQLGRVRPVTWRRMFGGVGLYADGHFFALIDNDTLYFKTGDTNRAEFVGRGMRAFQPFGPDTQAMDYHELPGEVLENVAELADWTARAVAVAATKRTKKRPARKVSDRPLRPPKVKGDGP